MEHASDLGEFICEVAKRTAQLATLRKHELHVAQNEASYAQRQGMDDGQTGKGDLGPGTFLACGTVPGAEEPGKGLRPVLLCGEGSEPAQPTSPSRQSLLLPLPHQPGDKLVSWNVPRCLSSWQQLVVGRRDRGL